MSLGLKQIILLLVVCLVFASSISFAEPKDKNIYYSIISVEKKRDLYRRVEVMLSERVDQAALEALSTEIKDLDSLTYRRTMISLRLLGEVDSLGYWAVSEFDPDFSIYYLRGNATDYKNLRDSRISVSGKVFGVWMSAWGMETKIVGYIHGKKVFLKTMYPSGESRNEEFLADRISGMIFLNNKESDLGDYGISANGDLDFYEDNVKFYTAKKIQDE